MKLANARAQGFLVRSSRSRKLRDAWSQVCADAKAPMIQMVVVSGKAYIDYDLILADRELTENQVAMLADVISGHSMNIAFDVGLAFGRTSAMPLWEAEQLAIDLAVLLGAKKKFQLS